MQILLFIVGFVLFISLIIIHEWGHYIMARRGGVDVEEFGLGFPPRAKGYKLKSGMLLSLNWLPLGGFVKLKGEHDSDKGKGTYGGAKLSTKVKIMVAGVTVNLIAGLILLTILALVGMPKLIDNQFTVASDTKTSHQKVLIGFIEEGSPAQKAGLRGHDAVLDVVGKSPCKTGSCTDTRIINTSDQLHHATQDFGGQTVSVKYQRGRSEGTKVIKLRTAAEAKDQGYLGVAPTELQIRKSTWSAPIVAVGFTKQLVVLTFQGLGHALAGLGRAIAGIASENSTARKNGTSQATSQTGGIVAIVAILWGGGDLGVNFVLMVIAVLSLTLAIMNILPIPALDGGRLVITLIYRALRRPLTREAEQRIHGTGMIVLLILFALITVVDVRRFIF